MAQKTRLKITKSIKFGNINNKSNDKNTKPCPKCNGTGRIKK